MTQTLDLYLNQNNNWDFVKEKITTSTIYRFDYKGILNESLTSFITKRKDKSNIEIINEIMGLENTKGMLNKYPYLRKKFLDNLKTSICSRRAEQGSYEKRSMKLQDERL